MADSDFVDVNEFCPNIETYMLYAYPENFAKTVLYPIDRCFLRKGTAEKLLAASIELEKLGLRMKVLDGYRPLSVQKKFWEITPNPNYVADPAIGSKHNRGAAVDVTLIDHEGKELHMPTEIDDFTEKAHRDYDDLPQKVISNRQILEDVMVSKGFLPLYHEWWHFDDSDWEKYSIEDVCIGDLAKKSKAQLS